ncbi:hypothetical protein [Burkholderia sp. BDU5]|uniref:hypothetical protein n=1 Tax=Burkholderia sp. BDU5 TaxID=1385590 RepID=UPI00075E4205|nr:hypothetical protein [Burkholderia sp. BDU5]KVE43621.1 hypothetical protein WS69_22405 [Burkholderia sp. BDU5]
MNCKPGDLAYVAKSDMPEALGLPVTVTEDGMQSNFGWAWVVRASSPITCWNYCTKRFVQSGEFLVPDVDLRPISGVPVTDGVSDEVTA